LSPTGSPSATAVPTQLPLAEANPTHALTTNPTSGKTGSSGRILVTLDGDLRMITDATKEVCRARADSSPMLCLWPISCATAGAPGCAVCAVPGLAELHLCVVPVIGPSSWPGASQHACTVLSGERFHSQSNRWFRVSVQSGQLYHGCINPRP
jgi:hypothetical protein